MKMNGYSLPVQVFSVKKNSSLTRLEISLIGRENGFGRYSKCANWSSRTANPSRRPLQPFNADDKRLARSATTATESSQLSGSVSARQFAHLAQRPVRAPLPYPTKNSAPKTRLANDNGAKRVPRAAPPVGRASAGPNSGPGTDEAARIILQQTSSNSRRVPAPLN